MLNQKHKNYFVCDIRTGYVRYHAYKNLFEARQWRYVGEKFGAAQEEVEALPGFSNWGTSVTPHSNGPKVLKILPAKNFGAYFVN